MLQQIPKLISQMIQAAPAVIGWRVGTEEPPYRAESLADGVEIRHYGPRVAAVTTVGADREAALRLGFGRLAGYIFGDNGGASRTGRIGESGGGQKIAMTAPVAQTGGRSDGWDVQFYMPARLTIDTLPEPNDDRVRLTELPAQSVAVLRFSGDRGPGAVTERTVQLREVLRQYGFEADGEPTAWFYDPPWTIPCLRRNEIAIPVEP
ncbi:SOUL family heme-binding protein [Mycobacterium sp. LTG2003]